MAVTKKTKSWRGGPAWAGPFTQPSRGGFSEGYRGQGAGTGETSDAPKRAASKKTVKGRIRIGVKTPAGADME